MKANQGKLRTPAQWAVLFAGKDADRVARMIFDCLSGYTVNPQVDVATIAAAVQALRSDSTDGSMSNDVSHEANS